MISFECDIKSVIVGILQSSVSPIPKQPVAPFPHESRRFQPGSVKAKSE